MTEHISPRQAAVAAEMINKMKASILYQAETTARSIQKNAESDASSNKSEKIYRARLKIEDEVHIKEKEIRAKKSVELSIAKQNARMEELKIKDKAVQEAVLRAEERLRQYVNDPEYKTLLHNLIFQGLKTLLESKVEIAVKQADAELVNNDIENLKSQLEEYINSNDSLPKLQKIDLSVSSYVLPDACIGGCVLICHEGKIQYSNTLEDRLQLACHDLYPQIRKIFIQ